MLVLFIGPFNHVLERAFVKRLGPHSEVLWREGLVCERLARALRMRNVSLVTREELGSADASLVGASVGLVGFEEDEGLFGYVMELLPFREVYVYWRPGYGDWAILGRLVGIADEVVLGGEICGVCGVRRARVEEGGMFRCAGCLKEVWHEGTSVS